MQVTLRDLSERLDAACKQREQEAAKRGDAQEQCRELRAAAEKMRVQVLYSVCDTCRIDMIECFEKFPFWCKLPVLGIRR